MAIEDIRNFVSVSADLGTGGQPTVEQLHEIAAAGFEVVVNLGLMDPRYCLDDEAGVTRSLGLTYHHIPVDFNAPRFEDLDRFLEIMDVSRDKKVFVHCAANYRVSSFIGLLGQARFGWTSDRADAHVRRVWQPNATWKTFIEAARGRLGSGESHASPAVRQATPEDAAAIADAHLDSIRSLGPAFYSPELVARWASQVTPSMYVRAMDEGEVFFVAVDKNVQPNVVVGFSSHQNDGDDDSVSVYVRGGVARRGIGSALLRVAESHAVESGARSLHIQASLAGLDFYWANGFEATGDTMLLPGWHMPIVPMRKVIRR